MFVTIKSEPNWDKKDDLEKNVTLNETNNPAYYPAISFNKEIKPEPQCQVDIKIEPFPTTAETEHDNNCPELVSQDTPAKLKNDTIEADSDTTFSILRDRLEISTNEETSSKLKSNPVVIQDLALSEYKTADQKYLCPVCEKIIPYKSYFSKHLESHNRPILECSTCRLTFRRKDTYDKHDCKTFECNVCNKLFRRPSNLYAHQRLKHIEKCYHCDKCSKAFANEKLLVKHKSSNCEINLKSSIKCEHCELVFYTKTMHQSHLRMHTIHKPYQCDHCKMYFKHKASLSRHLNLHNGGEVTCPVCKRNFSHKSVLRNHLKSHSGDRPFTCPVCSKTFSYKHNMKKHLLCHQKPKKLICTICSKRFPKESRLVYHMRSHTNEKPFLCKHCPKRFTTKQNVKKHYRSWHPAFTYQTELSDATIAKVLFKEIEERQRPTIVKKIHEIFRESDRAITIADHLKPNVICVPTPPVEEVMIKMEPQDSSDSDESD